MAVNRVTGLSGFDVEKTVADLMKAENTRLNNLKAQRQVKVWEQEAFRDVTKSLSAFQTEYFDYLKPETNFRSANAFALFTSNVNVAGVTSGKVTVTGSGELSSLDHKINSITQLATKDSYTSGQMDIASINGKTFEDPATPFATGMPTNFKMSLTIDKSTKSIDVDMTGVTTIEDFVTKLNANIASQFGTGFNNVAQVDTVGTGKRLKLFMPSNNVKVLSQTGSESSLSWIGITSGAQSNDYASKTLATQFAWVDNDLKNMKIEGKSLYDMGVRTTDNLSQLSQKVEAAGVGATLKYSTLTDKFELKALAEGESNSVDASNELLAGFGLNTAGSTHEVGKNAVFNLDGVDIVKSSNSFNIEGVNYVLNGTHAAVDGAINVSLKPDTQKIADRIKTFVNTYNGIIATIGAKLDEKVYRSFTPLTDDQKKDMEPEDIALWESKAKSGNLRNQADLQSMLRRMRTSFSDAVEGAGISLAEMGITNTANYKELGKLEISDETALKSAIENNYTKVVKLFTASSDKDYQDATNAGERFNESGIANRLNDVLQDMIRTTKGNSNSKGLLLEKAGKIGDTTETSSTLSKLITEFDDRIYNMVELLTTKENNYYTKFSRLESELARFNSQSSYLSSAFGG